MAAWPMPIPALEPIGLLSPGVHDAALSEVEAAFGSANDRRKELFQKLTQFVDVAKHFALFSAVYLDGSFVSDKSAPGDIDAVLEMGYQNLAKLLIHPSKMAILDHDAVKAAYEVDLYFEPAGATTPQDMRVFFQRIRIEDAILRKVDRLTRKGIIRVAI
jgi:hypothetical protein